MGHSTVETVLSKSLDYFNVLLQSEKKGLQFVPQTEPTPEGGRDLFIVRMAKKKNGKPNTDFPSKDYFTHPLVELDMKKAVGDTGIVQFCICYYGRGI